jgi:hypothetical protein
MKENVYCFEGLVLLTRLPKFFGADEASGDENMKTRTKEESQDGHTR